jgi:hypothetical protein
MGSKISTLTYTLISLEEAQERSREKVEWWKVEGPNGENVEERQLSPKGFIDRPVWHDANGNMYLGAWKRTSGYFSFDNSSQHCYQRQKGFGVSYYSEGYVRAGHSDSQWMSGPGKEIWLPSSPIWVENKYPYSAIKPRPTNKKREMRETIGLPYIYIGCYARGSKDDPLATAILKDGTTRIGPWKNGKPLGDWWEDHETSVTSPEDLAKLLSFASQSQTSNGTSPSTPADSVSEQCKSEGVARNISDDEVLLDS